MFLLPFPDLSGFPENLENQSEVRVEFSLYDKLRFCAFKSSDVLSYGLPLIEKYYTSNISL